MPPAICLRASHQRRQSPRAASAWGTAVDTLSRRLKGKAAPCYAARHLSPGISPATTKSPRGLCVGHGGRYPRPPPEGQSGTSLCRPPSVARHLAGNDKVPARPLRGARRSIPSAIACRAKQHLIMPPAIRHGASRPAMTKSPCGFCSGRGVRHPRPSPSGQSGISLCRPSSISGHLAGNDKVPARLLRGARRLAISAVDQ